MAINESSSSIRMELIQSLSIHEKLLFRSTIMTLNEYGQKSISFSRIHLKYKRLCIVDQRIPLSLWPAFDHLEELARF